ncbi:MAG: hypothetical protein CMJ89_06385 [Planctomycetes bacterium]|jgi:hypothetical protein|nr:hypothetical protein [Planctomycetota bacterium]
MIDLPRLLGPSPWILVALLSARSAAGAQVELLGGRLTLPPGPVAEAFEKIGGAPEQPHGSTEAWPRWATEVSRGAGEAHPWNEEPPWRRWVELVRAEARGNDPIRRAQLARLARLQKRDGDAWEHLTAVDDPAAKLALLPLFLPGVSPADLGRDTLPKGVLLQPALPPGKPGHTAGLGALVGRPASIQNVRIAEASIRLQVVIEADGVQVDLTHLEGAPVELRLLPPVPPGVTIALLYADWERVEDPLAPVTIRLDSSEDGRTFAVWGRFRPREERWPAPRPRDLSGLHAPLTIVHGGVEDPRLARFCEALEELFHRPCTLLRRAKVGEAAFFEPIQLRLGNGEDRIAFEHKFRSMISLAEGWALAR